MRRFLMTAALVVLFSSQVHAQYGFTQTEWNWYFYGRGYFPGKNFQTRGEETRYSNPYVDYSTERTYYSDGRVKEFYNARPEPIPFQNKIQQTSPIQPMRPNPYTKPKLNPQGFGNQARKK